MFRKKPSASVRARPMLVAAAALLAILAVPVSALGALTLKEKEEFLPFKGCPVQTAAICVYSTTTGGEFTLHNSTVPVAPKTVVLQGGLPTKAFTEQSLLAAVGGETLSKTPLTVPGGLTGIEGIGGEVTATAEIAGPVSGVKVSQANLLSEKGTAVALPIKVKLDNSALGESCYIGSDSEPITLHLTTGTTEPPSPGKPISGSRGTLEGKVKGKIVAVNNAVLVDNNFAVPGAQGCGGSLAPILDLAIDLKVGLPAAAGYNTAIMKGGLEETTAEFVKKYLPKPKK